MAAAASPGSGSGSGSSSAAAASSDWAVLRDGCLRCDDQGLRSLSYHPALNAILAVTSRGSIKVIDGTSGAVLQASALHGQSLPASPLPPPRCDTLHTSLSRRVSTAAPPRRGEALGSPHGSPGGGLGWEEEETTTTTSSPGDGWCVVIRGEYDQRSAISAVLLPTRSINTHYPG